MGNEESTYATQWESNAAKYRQYFEIKKISALANLHNLRNAAFVHGDPIKRRERMTAVDTICMRQQLGEISQYEVAELNRLSKDGVTFSLGRKEPALLLGWNMTPFYLLTVIGLSLGFYGRFGKGYNNLWLIGGFLPGSGYMLTNYVRQP